MKIQDFSDIIGIGGSSHSGTSVAASFFNKCGLGFGNKYPITQKKDINCGYNEYMQVYYGNIYILKAAEDKGGVQPSVKDAIRVTERIGDTIRQFGKVYDGHLMKAPRFAITARAWNKYIPRLKYFVFMVRNPYAVAISISKYQNKDFDAALNEWNWYGKSMLENAEKLNAVFMDYDGFATKEGQVRQIVKAFEKFDIEPPDVDKLIEGVYNKEENHRGKVDIEIEMLPPYIKNTYEKLMDKV